MPASVDTVYLNTVARDGFNSLKSTYQYTRPKGLSNRATRLGTIAVFFIPVPPRFNGIRSRKTGPDGLVPI